MQRHKVANEANQVSDWSDLTEKEWSKSSDWSNLTEKKEKHLQLYTVSRSLQLPTSFPVLLGEITNVTSPDELSWKIRYRTWFQASLSHSIVH